MRLSLELRHLPNSHLKGDPLPRVVMIEHSETRQYGGYYVVPHSGDHVLEDGRGVPARNGVIVVTSGMDAITHELRHHQQAVRGWQNLYGAFTFDGSMADYWRAIRRYFRRNAHELDALLYERRYCPNPVNAAWLDVTLRERL